MGVNFSKINFFNILIFFNLFQIDFEKRDFSTLKRPTIYPQIISKNYQPPDVYLTPLSSIKESVPPGLCVSNQDTHQNIGQLQLPLPSILLHPPQQVQPQQQIPNQYIQEQQILQQTGRSEQLTILQQQSQKLLSQSNIIQIQVKTSTSSSSLSTSIQQEQARLCKSQELKGVLGTQQKECLPPNQKQQEDGQNADHSVQKDHREENACNAQKQTLFIGNNKEDIGEEKLDFEENESEESFWEYIAPDDYQPIDATGNMASVQNQSGNAQRGKQKGENVKKKGAQSLFAKDPFFGIDPKLLVVKDFPQGEDEQSVFEWWDQIDDIYFPSKLREGFLKMLSLKYPKDFKEVIKNLDQVNLDEVQLMSRIPLNYSSQQENSSLYYQMIKDVYCDETVPFKMHSYLTVLFCFGIGDCEKTPSQIPQGLLGIYKLKSYDKRRPLTVERKEYFEEFCQNLDIISTLNFKKVQEWNSRIEPQIQGSNLEIPEKTIKNIKSNREKPDVSEFEPNIFKQFINESIVIPIEQGGQQSQISFEKNKITLKLKKLIILEKEALSNALQQSHFLNAFLGSRRKGQNKEGGEEEGEHPQLCNLEKTQIENNIFSMEYLIFKLGIGQKLKQLKEKVLKEREREGNQVALRLESVKINDNLKWLAIRKNLILGFGDRIPYDSVNYFKNDEKFNIALSHEDILREKLNYEKMTKSEQETFSYQQKSQHEGSKITKSTQKKEVEEDVDGHDENVQIMEEEDNSEEEEESEEGDDNQIDNEDEQMGEGLMEDNSMMVKQSAQKNQRGQLQGNACNSPQKPSEKRERQGGEKKKKKPKKKNQHKLLETECSVCFHHVNNDNNIVVYCSQCNGSFHKNCYGIDFIPEEKFLCKKCELKNIQFPQWKKKNGTGLISGGLNQTQSRLLREEIGKQFRCNLCMEILLPVISIQTHDSVFFHPTCLFIFNYAIYQDARLQFRPGVNPQTIIKDIKKQNHIACEHCASVQGIKVKCCQSTCDGGDQLGCNYYIHPFCAFFNGMEIWVEERDQDADDELKMVASQFKDLKHLGLKIMFKCKRHADKIARNYDEQTYYRRFQINYRNICQFETFEEYLEWITKQREREEQPWKEVIKMEQAYKEQYTYITHIKLNTLEIVASSERERLFYEENPKMREYLTTLEDEEEEEGQNDQEDEKMDIQFQGTQKSPNSFQDSDKTSQQNGKGEGHVNKKLVTKILNSNKCKKTISKKNIQISSKISQKCKTHEQSNHNMVLSHQEEANYMDCSNHAEIYSSSEEKLDEIYSESEIKKKKKKKKEKKKYSKKNELIPKNKKEKQKKCGENKPKSALSPSQIPNQQIEYGQFQTQTSERVKRKVLMNSRNIAHNGKIGRGLSIFADKKDSKPKEDIPEILTQIKQPEQQIKEPEQQIKAPEQQIQQLELQKSQTNKASHKKQTDSGVMKSAHSDSLRLSQAEVLLGLTKYNLRKQQTKNYKMNRYQKEDNGYIDLMNHPSFIESQRQILRQLNIDNDEQNSNEEDNVQNENSFSCSINQDNNSSRSENSEPSRNQMVKNVQDVLPLQQHQALKEKEGQKTQEEGISFLDKQQQK